jgi:hypothetical protein
MAEPQRQIIAFSGGTNTTRDEGMVGVNQLVKSIGLEYVSADAEMIHKIEGRSLFGSISGSAKIRGLELITYDDETAYLLGLSGTNLYLADVSNGFTGTFTAGSGIGATRKDTDSKMSAAHYQNRWYVCTQQNSNAVVEADGTFIDHGMYAPNLGKIALTIGQIQTNTLVMGQTTNSHSAGPNRWKSVVFDGGKDYNDQYNIVAGTVLKNTDETASVEFETTFTTTFAGRVVEFWHNLTDDTSIFQAAPGDNSDQPEEPKDWKVTIAVSTSENDGSSFVAHSTIVVDRNMRGLQKMQIPVASDSTGSDQVVLKIELTADNINGLDSVTYGVYKEVVLSDGGGVSTFTNTAGSMYYAITEYDQARQWESPLSRPAELRQDDTTPYGRVEVTLPTEARSRNATHYNIYRTSNQNTSYIPSEMGYVGTVDVNTTTFSDLFNRYTPNEIPTDPLYEWLILDEFGISTFWEKNSAPPPLTFIGSFRGTLFGLAGRRYVQAMGGRPQSWPQMFTIDRMPFKENTELLAGHQVGDTLWIGGVNGCVILDHPIETRAGSLRLPGPRRLDGAPGVTGSYASTPLSAKGEPMVAWVSNHGVYLSNMVTFNRITDDINWEALVEESKLSDAVLFWREKKEQLVLHYTANGGSTNDSYMLIHMGAGQTTKQGRPLITMEHSGDFACRTGGRIGGVWKEFVGHVSAAGVYLEGGSATADASNSYDGSGNIPVHLKTGRQYFSGGVDVGRAQLYTSAPTGGTTISLSVSYHTGRDTDENDRNTDDLLALTGTRGRWHDFNVNQAGDWMQWELQTVGQVKFSIGPVAPQMDTDDAQGVQQVT